MYWLIENKEQLKYLEEQKYKEVFIEIIPLNDKYHPSINDISLIYFHPKGDKGYMLCVNHNDTLNLEKELIFELLNKIDKIWVRNKKNVLYYFPSKNLLDLNILSQIEEPQTKVYEHFYRQYPKNPNINKIIPIVKHFEYCENIYIKAEKIIKTSFPNYFSFYNNKGCIVFFGIEKNGIQINEKIFNKYYSNINPVYSVKNSKIFTSYNLYTTTRRPSNSFNNVNFAALDKNNGVRQMFIPTNNKFVEMDISSYHPVLAGKLIGYEFTSPVYETFANQMKINVESAKEAFFNVIYGGNFAGLENIDFFVKIKEYITEQWKTYNTQGYIECPISNWRFNKEELTDMNPYKLFNYQLQNMESSMNILILWDIFQILKNKNSKIVLYTYDAILIDFDENEINELEQIKNIFKKYKLKIKMKEGTNYDFAHKQ